MDPPDRRSLSLGLGMPPRLRWSRDGAARRRPPVLGGGPRAAWVRGEWGGLGECGEPAATEANGSLRFPAPVRGAN